MAQQDPPKALNDAQEEELLPLLSPCSLYLSLVPLSTTLVQQFFNTCAEGLCINVFYSSPGITPILWKTTDSPLKPKYWAEIPSDPSWQARAQARPSPVVGYLQTFSSKLPFQKSRCLGSAWSTSGSFAAKKEMFPPTLAPKSRKQHTKPSHLTGSRHMGDRPSSPIYPTAE